MTPAEQLRAAKALIDTPERWTKGKNARGVHGGVTDPTGKDAVCRCSNGAIVCSTQRWNSSLGRKLDAAVPKAFSGYAENGFAARFVQYNDHPDTTHADIMKLFDDAIALAEAAQ